MVRINIIPPELLADQHLLAEWNETFMLIAYIKNYSKSKGKIPARYTLNKGHMKFFKNKLTYLLVRLYKIYNEATNRGYNMEIDRIHNITKVLAEEIEDDRLWGFYVPDYIDYLVIIERIRQKIHLKPDYYTYCKRKLSLKSWDRRYDDFLKKKYKEAHNHRQ